MLYTTQITKCQAGSQDWLNLRLGRFTSSEIHNIATVKGIGETGMGYIRKKVGEAITGQSDEKEYGFIESLANGIQNEAGAVMELATKNGWGIVVTQKAILATDGSLSTPDAINIIDEEKGGYKVETVEVKCPIKFNEYLMQRDCLTPEDLKSNFPKYYWQVIDQMLVCGATVGHFFTYHHKFPIGNRGHQITFKKVPLWEDFKFLEARKAKAKEIFDEMLAKYTKTT